VNSVAFFGSIVVVVAVGQGRGREDEAEEEGEAKKTIVASHYFLVHGRV
jgi:hypothetical protein